MLVSGNLHFDQSHSCACWESFWQLMRIFCFSSRFSFQRGSPLSGKSCLLKQHIHSPLQAPISLICQLQNHGNRRKEARCRIHQNTIYSFLLDQSEQGVCGAPENIPVKNTWNYLNTQQPDQNQGFEFCKLRFFPWGCFCCSCAEDFMGKVDGVQLCCSAECCFIGFGEVLTSEILLVILIMTKAVCLYPWNAWRWLGNWWISSCAVGKQFFRFFEAWRCSKGMLLKPFQKVKVGF